MQGPVRTSESRAGAIALNLTALIDVVFLLIMFFVLVAKFGRYPTLPLELPRIGARTADAIDPGTRPSIDVIPREQRQELEGAYRFNGRSFEASQAAHAELIEALRLFARQQPGMDLSIRAERDERYDLVRPAIEAAAAAGLKRVHLMTLPREAGGGE